MKKNLIFLMAFVALFLFSGTGGVSHASIAIHDDRATAAYWTNRIPGGDAVALTGEEIAALNREMRKKTESLRDLMDCPAEFAGAEVKELILDAQQDFRGEAEPGEYYDKGGVPITKSDFTLAQDNCNLEALPDAVGARYGVITERTDMRLLPTSKYYFDDPSFQHYDDLQGTVLDPCEPVIVLNTSKDGAFAFAVGRYYKGWVSLGAIGFTDRETWTTYAAPRDFLVVTANKKTVHVKGAWHILFQMGSIIPLKSPALQNGSYRAIIPVEVNGHLSENEVSIRPDSTVHLGFLPCTPDNFARQSLKFLGDVYGWGGMEESVDCSSFVQDVYHTMGIELPRDADQQELVMPRSVSLEGLGTDARLQKAEKAPTGALLFKPGHVMLCLGTDDKGTPLVIHSASSYFTFPDGKAKKHYIRQVLVSDLSFQNGKGVRTIDGLTSIGSCW